MTAGFRAARRARGGWPVAPIEFIDEHRFKARFRAELARRPMRLATACLATVIAPTLVVAASGLSSRSSIAPPLATAMGMGVAVSQPAESVEEDQWVTGAQTAAATCPGLPATVLLAIGLVETGHGRVVGPSSAGARGPMQFLPSTWVAYGADGDGDGRADIMNSTDALHAAARLLCANGGADPAGLRSAVWNYNHSDDYVERVLEVAGLEE